MTPRSSDAIDRRGWHVYQRTTDARGFETELIKNQARNGTSLAIRELVEGTVAPKAGKSLAEYDHHLSWRHRQKRQSTHDSTRAFPAEQADRRELGGIHPHHTRGRKPVREQLDEGRAIFDKRKALLAVGFDLILYGWALLMLAAAVKNASPTYAQ